MNINFKTSLVLLHRPKDSNEEKSWDERFKTPFLNQIKQKTCEEFFFIAFFLFTTTANAQHLNRGIKLVHYVFSEFTPGTIKMKSGEAYSKVLNYNILTNEMIFNNNGKYLAIANPENVDKVNINDRKFIPLNKKFYEVLVNSVSPLLLEFTATISEPGVSTGYGGTSTITASSSFKTLISTGGAYDLKLPDGFTVIPGYTYWIMKDGKLEKAGSKKQFIKIFPRKKEIANDFIKKNDTNFSKRDDVISLIKQIE